MMRSALAAACVVLLAIEAGAQAPPCNLNPPTDFTSSCTTPIASGTPTSCKIQMANHGPNPCTGTWSAAIGTLDAGTISNPHTDAPWSCALVNNVALPTEVNGHLTLDNAFQCQGSLTLNPGTELTVFADVTPTPAFTGNIFFTGYLMTFVNVDQMNGTINARSYGSIGSIVQNCTAIPTAPGAAPSGVPYFLDWNSTPTGGPYETQEATAPNFANALSITEPSNPFHEFQHTVSVATTFYYRVRPIQCAGSPGSFGPSAQVVILPQQPPTSRDFDIVVPVGTTDQVSQDVTFSGLPPNAKFTAATDKPFLTVTPSSGTVRSDGTVTVTVKGDPSTLGIGANTGTVTITLSNGKGSPVPNDTRSNSTTVSISLVTPVNNTPKSGSTNNELIVPAVAHLAGSAVFRSDIRITNAGTSPATYLLTFTPQNTDGTTSGKQTSITVQPDQTVALNDVLKDFFGFAQPADAAGGVLDIRVLSGSAATTFVSSRTYALDPVAGTFGQFIPAVPVSKFLKAGAGSLTLTQVSEQSAFHTNIGLVEGLGAAASGRLLVFDASGLSRGEFPFSLRPFEFQQLSSFLASKGISITDARIELVVDSPSGSVTTYASVLDNVTKDPLLVSPIQQANLSANRYVLPGMADFNVGTNFHSDIRIYNGSSSPVNATATFYPLGNGAPIAQNISIGVGEIKVYNNVLPTLFGAPGTGGAIVISTAANTPLVVSGRTYSNASTGGTYGQFIPAVTPADGVGAGESPLQILQLEQSANFRSNLGLNELTGNPVSVQVTLIPPDSKTAAVLPQIDLQPNEFRQLTSVFLQAFPGQNVYNGRATVKVVGGSGRVTAYGSVVDNLTSDPTYVPAQK